MGIVGRRTAPRGGDSAVTGRRVPRRRSLLAVGLLSLLTACSGQGGDEAASQEAPEAPASATTHLGARAALTGFECGADEAGSWSAKGTLNNADGAKAVFVVRISVAGKDSHVVAGATRNVTVDAASQAPLDVAAFGKASGKGLDCSVHVTRAVS